MKLSSIIVLSLMFILMGCGPMVRLHRLKPAEINMSAMRRLTVLDFNYSHGRYNSAGDLILTIISRSAGLNYGDDYENRKTASYIANKLRAALINTHYFEIINPSKLRDISLNNGAELKEVSRTLGIDAILAGKLDDAVCELEPFFMKEKIYEPSQKQEIIVKVPWKRQKCRLSLSYSIIKTIDNTLVSEKYFSEYRSEEVSLENLTNLHEPEYWFEQMIDTIIPKISRQLVPYEITETRFLKSDKTYDPEMKRAATLAEAGSLTRARNLFLQRWQTTANPAAGYNAAILYEVTGDLEKALQLLGDVIKIDSSYSITREHRRVLEALEERKRAEEQLR